MRFLAGGAVTLAIVVLGTGPISTAHALSLGTGTGATLSPLQPGRTAVGSGSLTASTLLSLGWTLTVQAGAGASAGHLQAAGAGCGGSDPQLSNALSVTVTSTGGLGGFVSAGAVTIGEAPKQVASATLALLSIAMTTSYSQVIPASEVMRTGCVYGLTITYTLQ